mgnify:CR=1 FL=1
MISPDLGLNGSGARNLMDQYLDCVLALDKVSKAMIAARPHGRDYQNSCFAQFDLAREQHFDLERMLDQITGHFNALYMDVNERSRR